MTTVLFFLICLFAFPGFASQEKFDELKGDHFIIYYQGKEKDAREVLRSAEKYYDSIASFLGYGRIDNFWLWENRCKIYIYETNEAYFTATESSAWSGGHADLTKKEIYTFENQNNFLESTLPHEIAHLIFKDYVGLKRSVALWLHEGVALNAEESRKEYLTQLGKKIFKEKKYIPFDQLTKIRSAKELSDNQVPIFYAESLLIVEYLITKHYSDRFIEFCQDIRDNYEINEALYRNYSNRGFENLKELEAKLLEHYSD